MISTYQRLKDNLEYLKLKKASECLDEVIDFITANELSFTEGLLRLTDVEMDHRKMNLIKAMVKVGAFPFIKEVKDFDTISNVLDEKEAGDKIKITIKYASGKEYKEKTVEVTLSTYSQVN